MRDYLYALLQKCIFIKCSCSIINNHFPTCQSDLPQLLSFMMIYVLKEDLPMASDPSNQILAVLLVTHWCF